MAKEPTVKLTGENDLHLELPLDKEKIDAIHRCLAKGHLTITMNKVDLAGGKMQASYLYD